NERKKQLDDRVSCRRVTCGSCGNHNSYAMMEAERYLARAMDLSFTIRNVLVILVDNKRNR
ncbi:MAG: hypothetical protein QN823_00550, partial [Nitrososphaeraceae archaeon]|nr:hypothetical protein [Nitrososphaeraceae archaeon]